MLPHRDVEPAFIFNDVQRVAGKGVFDRAVE
jgi:hypothetical protein